MAIDRFQCPDFTLRQLQYAIAIADTGGFGSAAEACGVSQPSLSAQVAKLEDTLGVRLFDRDTRVIRVTPAGERLLPVLRASLSAAMVVEVAAATLRDPYAIPVRVAVIPTIAPYLLPRAVEELAARPGPQVHWLELRTSAAEEAVAQGTADAMVIADPPRDSTLVVRTLGWEPLLAAVPPDADAPDPLPVAWLRARELLLLDDGHCLRDQVLSLCRLPAARQSPYRATSLPTLVQMVSAGLGVTVLPAMAVAVECARSRVVPLRFVEGDIGRTLHMAWRSDHPLAAVMGEVADRFECAIASLLAGFREVDRQRL